MHLMTVAPLAEGWRVCTETLANDMVFKSGRLAELTARGLAARLSRAGLPAEVRIHLRDNSLGARLSVPWANISERELAAA